MEPLRARATRQYPPDPNDTYYPVRPASSAIRYAATQGGRFSEPVSPRIRYRPRPGVYLISGLCMFLGLYLVWTLAIVPTANNVSTQWHYGDSKVSILTADVGRGQEEFVAFTYNSHIVVLEIGKTYQGYTANISVTGSHLVTLGVKDVNMDGKPDLVVTIDGAEGSFVLFNTGKGFSWSQ